MRQGPKCGRPKHQGEGPCTQPAGWGTPHPGYGACKLHGGCLGPAVRAAENARVEAEAAAVLARIDAPPVVNPYLELQRLAGQALAWKDTCAGILNRLQAEDLRYASKLAIEQARSEVAFWERSLTLAGNLLTSLAKLGIEAKLAEIEEMRARALVSAFNAAVTDAGVTGDVLQALRRSFSQRIKAITTAA